MQARYWLPAWRLSGENMTIRTGLKKSEDKLDVRRERLRPPVVILTESNPYGESDRLRFPEPIDEWNCSKQQVVIWRSCRCRQYQTKTDSPGQKPS